MAKHTPTIRHGVVERPVNTIRQVLRTIPEIEATRKEQELEVLNLSIGMPHISPSRDILIAYHKAELTFLENATEQELVNYSKYSPAWGKQAARESIANLLNYRYPTLGETSPIKPEETMPTNGGTHALQVTLETLSSKRQDGENKKIAIFKPFYPPHIQQIEKFGYTPVIIDPLEGESHTEALTRVFEANKDIDIVLLNDPHNPTGHKFSKEELQAIGDLFLQDDYKGLSIIHERIYGDITHGEEAQFLLDVVPALKDERVYVEIFSAAKELLGMPDAHIGGLYAPSKVTGANGEEFNLLQAIANTSLLTVSAIPVESQHLLSEAIDWEISGKNKAWKEAMQQEYKNNVTLFTECLMNTGFGLYKDTPPGGTFYAAIHAKEWIGQKIPNEITMKNSRNENVTISGLRDTLGKTTFESDVDIAKFLLHAGGVAMVPLSGFGANPQEGAMRVSCANSAETLMQATKIMGDINKAVLRENNREILGSFTQAAVQNANNRNHVVQPPF